MIKELYVNKLNEISVNVTNSKADAIRKKNITKSGCRVYDNGYIGISGTLGEADETTFERAEKNLQNKIPYKYEPCKNMKRSRDLRKSKLSGKEFLDKCEELLDTLNSEFPDFIFSDKINSVEMETYLKNDAGLDYVSRDRYFITSLVIKHKDSLDIFDTCIDRCEREFDLEAILEDVRNQLKVFNNNLQLPTQSKIPVIASFNNFSEKIIESLNGSDLGKGISLFSDKVNKKIFSKDFTLYLDRSEDNIGAPFFDAEGSTIKNDKFPLIEEGVMKYGYTDKKTSTENNTVNTSAACADYDGLPFIEVSYLNERRFTAEPGNKTLREIIGDKDAIYIIAMEGGDCTSEGDFASPVQMAYLVRDGKLAGRLPQFSVYGNIYDMFGKDFLGVTSDKCYMGSNAMVINMNIKLN